MEEMRGNEWKEFILAGSRTAKLATVRRDGSPHVVPVWFDLDGNELVFTTWHETTKAKAIRRDPRVSLCVDDERPPFSFVLIEGRATVSTNLDELRYWARRIAGRYMGEELAEIYGERNGVEGELLVRVRPTKLIGRRNIAD